MGSGASSPRNSSLAGTPSSEDVPRKRFDSVGSEDLNINRYTSANLPTDIECDCAESAWKMVTEHNFNSFHDLHECDLDSTNTDPKSIFVKHFFDRLFELKPSSVMLFGEVPEGHSINRTQRVLMNFFMRTLSQLVENPHSEEIWSGAIQDLVDNFSKIGLRKGEYVIMGKALVHGLKATIGPNKFTPAMHSGWTKLYAHVLRRVLLVLRSDSGDEGSGSIGVDLTRLRLDSMGIVLDAVAA